MLFTKIIAGQKNSVARRVMVQVLGHQVAGAAEYLISGGTGYHVTLTEVDRKDGVRADWNNFVRLPADRKFGTNLLRHDGGTRDGLEPVDIAAQRKQQDAVHMAL